MPLTMLNIGEEAIVKEYNVRENTKKFLEGLGIMAGVSISVVSDMGGDLIVSVKGSRIAISKGVAQKLIVAH